MSIRILVPCVIAVILAAVAFFSLQTAPPEDPFDDWIAQIEAGKDVTIAYHAAETYLQFSENALGGQSNPEILRKLADRRFLLGQAMYAQKTPQGYEKASQQFVMAVKLSPSLRHGWPFFLGAQALEQRGDDASAITWYQQAAAYDYGQLAVNAHYRAALIEIRQPTAPLLDPRPAYNFIRFIANDPIQNISHFQGASWNERPEAMYLRSLAALSEEDANQAIRKMEGYLRLRPDDPSAQYQLDAMRDWRREGSYPADGNLLRSYLAPRAFDDNGPVLLNNAELMTDVYFHFPPQQIALDLDYLQPKGAAVTWTISFNGESQTIEPPAQQRASASLANKRIIVSTVFRNVQQRNLILVQPTLSKLSNDNAQNRIRLLNLTLLPIEASPTNVTEPPN